MTAEPVTTPRTYRRWRKGGWEEVELPPDHGPKGCRHRTYRLTCDEYDALLERSGGGCEICGRGPRLVIDHDHATGAVRGLLCNKCNHWMQHADTGSPMVAWFEYMGMVDELGDYLRLNHPGKEYRGRHREDAR